MKSALESAIATAKSEAITSAQALVSNAKEELQVAINGKADAATVNASVASLQEAIEALEAIKDNYATADLAINAELTAAKETLAGVQARIEMTEKTVVDLQSAIVALQQANASNAELKAEFNALKDEIDEADQASGCQTATTVLALIGLACDAGLIAFVVIFER